MSNTLPREPISRPGEPTDAPPGSPRKIRVLQERASRREALFHPQDSMKRYVPDREPEDTEELLEVDLELDLELDEVEADLAG